MTAGHAAHLRRLETTRAEHLKQARTWLTELDKRRKIQKRTPLMGVDVGSTAGSRGGGRSEVARWLTGESGASMGATWAADRLLPLVQLALVRQKGPRAMFRSAKSLVQRKACFGATDVTVGAWMRPLGIPKFTGTPESWMKSMLPVGTGRRHLMTKRKVDAKRLMQLRVHKRQGLYLVSARRIISDFAKRGLPVGAKSWGRRARALLRGALCRMFDATEPAPTLVAAPSQLLYRVGNGGMCVVAVEEEAAMLEVSIVENPVLGSILMGVSPILRQGDTRKGLSTMQAHAALADGMHVGAVAAVIRRGWQLAGKWHTVRDKQWIGVHSSCAGLVNAGFLAARRAMKELGVEARLVCATELSPWRREALSMQYPSALIGEQATAHENFGRHAQVLVASWPCKPYSTANVEGAVPPLVWCQRAWNNTRLICEILARACAQDGGPPLLLVFENVPGLLTRKKCRPMLKHLLSEMALSPYTWYSQIVCARLHVGGQCRRPRLFFVGVRRAEEEAHLA